MELQKGLGAVVTEWGALVVDLYYHICPLQAGARGIVLALGADLSQKALDAVAEKNTRKRV